MVSPAEGFCKKGLAILTIILAGAVSGPKGTLVMLQDALKKAWPTVPEPPKPADVAAKLQEAAKVES